MLHCLTSIELVRESDLPTPSSTWLSLVPEVLCDAHCGRVDQALVDDHKVGKFGVGHLDAALENFNNRRFKLLDSRNLRVPNLNQIQRPSVILQILTEQQILFDNL